jgi:predicted transposase YdaD
MGANTRYKDSVFSFLFSDPDTLRELYCAIEGLPLNPGAVIKINTLRDVLYMEQYNDISFTVDNKLVILIEHQSTVNANLPLRLLLYAARIYEKLIEQKELPLERAMKEAIDYCIGHGILRQFLETNGSEVRNMLLNEWNIDEAREVWQEEAGETKAAEIANNLLGMGLSVEQTAQGTGLTVEAVQRLAKSDEEFYHGPH